jgi:hypothetical protein
MAMRVPVDGVFECKRGVEFHVSPEEAMVEVNGHQIGKADDWDGMGGGQVFFFPHPGVYLARFTLEGYRSALVRIIVRPAAKLEVVKVDTELEEIDD